MAPNTTFESLNFNPFIATDSLMIVVKTLMSTFFTTMSLPLTQIIFPQTILAGLLKISRKNSFSVLHLNIKSLNKTLNLLQDSTNR